MHPLLRRFAPTAALALALAACDGDGGTRPAERLKPADVAGSYRICALTFDPTNQVLPDAQLLGTVIDTTARAAAQPTLALGSDGSFSLFYIRRENGFLQQLRGTASFGTVESAQVALSLGDASNPQIVKELLLPRALGLRFTSTPSRRLELRPEQAAAYSVSRTDYASAAGISEEGLQPTIGGRLTAVFSASGCS